MVEIVVIAFLGPVQIDFRDSVNPCSRWVHQSCCFLLNLPIRRQTNFSCPLPTDTPQKHPLNQLLRTSYDQMVIYLIDCRGLPPLDTWIKCVYFFLSSLVLNDKFHLAFSQVLLECYRVTCRVPVSLPILSFLLLA